MTSFVFRDFCPEAADCLDCRVTHGVASVTFGAAAISGPPDPCGRAGGFSSSPDCQRAWSGRGEGPGEKI